MTNLALRGGIVEKRNILNEMRGDGWTLQELRFFALYLSRINARDPNTRHIKLKLTEFTELMDISRFDVRNIRPVRDSLLQKIVVVPTENGESAFQLFKGCEIEKDNDGEWYIEFDAHDKALPLMFEFKEKYVTYRVINIMRLKGSNHVRMYEILKQYERLGVISLPLDELRKRLGIEQKQYKVWKDFRRWVLDECRKALEEHTDIKYTYEPIKRGSGKTSPVKGVKFIIEMNNKPEQLTLIDDTSDAIIAQQEIPPFKKYQNPITISLASALDFQFDETQMLLIKQMLDSSPHAPKHLEKRINFLKNVRSELDYQKAKKFKTDDPVREDFSFVRGIIKNKLAQLGEKNENN